MKNTLESEIHGNNSNFAPRSSHCSKSRSESRVSESDLIARNYSKKFFHISNRGLIHEFLNQSLTQGVK